MEKLDLFQALGEVDDDILEDAEEFLHRTPDKRPAPAWMKWGSLAACAALAVCAVWFTTGTPVDTIDPRASEELPVSQSEAPSQEVGAPTSDAPAVEPEALTRPSVETSYNELPESPPESTENLFALMWEDFVPMTREELLDYYGVTLPVEEPFPNLFALGPGEENSWGIYRRTDGTPYFDTNVFSFGFADGTPVVYVGLDKAFHLPASSWELPGDELRFTRINGWELALFHWVDEDGSGCRYTEFQQRGVNYRVTGKGMGEQEFAVLLEALLEPREDYAPGEVRTFRGTYGGGIGHQFLTTRDPDGSAAVEESWCGPLFLDLDEGAEYASLSVELPPEQAAQLADLSLGDTVTVRFTGEPATVGTVWKQQLVSIERG